MLRVGLLCGIMEMEEGVLGDAQTLDKGELLAGNFSKLIDWLTRPLMVDPTCNHEIFVS